MYRILSEILTNKSKKVLVLIGPRQVGKTTILKNTFPDATYINLEKSNYIDVFNSRDIDKIQSIIDNEKGDKQMLILDEVQRLNDPGLVVKVMKDEMQYINIVVSGSSALEIAHKASESLAGRKIAYRLFPLTFSEYLMQSGVISETSGKLNFEFLKNDYKNSGDFKSHIKHALTYGLYPEILNIDDNSQKINYLIELADSVILKDIFYLNLVKNTKNLISLLKLLAYQIGGQINYSDIASRIGMSRQTVIDYMEILKQTFVIYTLSPFRKNRRDEIGKTEKIYFVDLGIRNALIDNFSEIEFRPDYGNVFENFVINEILKLNDYYKLRYGLYYWRTKQGSEVDLILDKDDKQIGCEIKIKKKEISYAFKNTYQDAQTYSITMDNISTLII